MGRIALYILGIGVLFVGLRIALVFWRVYRIKKLMNSQLNGGDISEQLKTMMQGFGVNIDEVTENVDDSKLKHVDVIDDDSR